jgi:hypothetical protein
MLQIDYINRPTASEILDLLYLDLDEVNYEMLNQVTSDGNLSLFEFLIYLGINPDDETISIAVSQSQNQIVEWLFDHGWSDQIRNQHIADIALGWGNIELLNYLIDEGIYPTSEGKNRAIQNGFIDQYEWYQKKIFDNFLKYKEIKK